MHQWEFHPEDPVCISAVIPAGIQDIHILLIKVDYGWLSLSLSPDMDALYILFEIFKMHEKANNTNEKEDGNSDAFSSVQFLIE